MAGLQPGQPVLLYSGNSIFFPVVLVGIIMAGGIFTGANPSYTAREVAYQLTDSGAAIMLCADSALETGLDAARAAGLNRNKVFIFDDGDSMYDTFDESPRLATRGRLGQPHWTSLISSREDGAKFQWRDDPSALNDTAALNYSSGTTGLPKGVEITHLNYVSNARQHMHLARLKPDFYEGGRERMRWLCFLPMYHAMAQTMFAIGAPAERIPAYILRRFDFQKMLEAIQNFRISQLYLVPPLVVAMAKSPLTRQYDLSSVTGAGSGAAPLGQEISREFEKLWPDGTINLKQGYGMTEYETTCSAIGWDPNKTSDSYSVGEPNPNIEIKFVDTETLKEVAQGERGEIWARGPNVMKGYWNKPKATEEILMKDGWLRTGDVGMIDEKGQIFVVDRLKELIKVKGNQVAPAELEAQLLENPAVVDAAVIGITINGEELPRAYVVKAPGKDFSSGEVAKYMESKVAPHKRITGGVQFVDAIAKNPSQITTSPQGREFLKEKFKKVFMRKFRVDMASIKVSARLPLAPTAFPSLESDVQISALGTWIPLQEGRLLATKNGCFDKLRSIFDFVPGDRSPPPAPKHSTATTNRPKAPRGPPPAKARKVVNKTAASRQPEPQAVQPEWTRPARPSQMSDVSYSIYSDPLPQNDEEVIPDDETMSSDSGAEMIGNTVYRNGSNKRKRDERTPEVMSAQEQQHLIWSDELLDYFMLQKSDEPSPAVPEPPPYVDLNRGIDDKGNCPVHWAAAMGDLNIVNDFVRRGASIETLTANGETPLMRAVTFTNNWDRQTMDKLVDILYPTVGQRDAYGSTVIHHIAASTCSKSKYQCARYYLTAILQKLSTVYGQREIAMLLDQQDHNGDTAILLAAKYGARKCVRVMTMYGASVSIPNRMDDIAEHHIEELNARRRDRNRQGSSSPIPRPSDLPMNGISSQPRTLDAGMSSSRVKQYMSEAANLVATQLPTLIAARVDNYAEALEAELESREADIQESQRLLEQRKEEIASLKKRSDELETLDEMTPQDDAQLREHDGLVAEARKLLEAEQEEELVELVNGAGASSGDPADDGLAADALNDKKIQLAHELRKVQANHSALISDIVAAQGVAGIGGERSENYKRLISTTLKLRVEDVESILPEMIAELEEARGETVGHPTVSTGRMVDGEGSGVAERSRDVAAFSRTAPVRMGMGIGTGTGTAQSEADLIYAGTGVGAPTSGTVGVVG
ncbi:MAG: putative NRPS-like protein biosynthetic cluster [Alyxoria varia]|nr:MAG: putative NRPS-like protein biosynthetic cluster [Alyxoria varia]